MTLKYSNVFQGKFHQEGILLKHEVAYENDAEVHCSGTMLAHRDAANGCQAQPRLRQWCGHLGSIPVGTPRGDQAQRQYLV